MKYTGPFLLASVLLVLSGCSEAGRLNGYSSENLIGYWSFNETEGTTVYDHSPNGLIGEFDEKPPKRTEGMYGGALEFDGNFFQVKIPYKEVLNFDTGDFTISYWCKYDVVTSNFQDIVMSQGEIYPESEKYSLHRGWILFNEAYYLGSGNPRDLSCSGPFLKIYEKGYQSKNYPGRINNGKVDISDKKWHHVVFVRSGKTLHYYLDGKQVASNKMKIPTANFNIEEPLRMGVGYTGLLDEVLIYKRAFTGRQVLEMFQFQPGTSSIKIK
jgi:sialidase-1